MALEVNSQNLFQNAQFQQFVDFAEAAAKAGKQKAIARLDAGELGGIANRTIKPGSGDWVGVGAGRLASLKKANNITRDAFMKAVSDMFGGMNRIPASVKEAMKLEDYGKGKPLTARRILAVKAAIDAVKLATFQSADTERIALTMGFVKSEFPKLARTAHFYAQATGLSELDALTAVAEPNSKPNRLMQYGGRFLHNAENFANGLRLMDSFKDWFTALRATKNTDGNSFANAQSFTDLNIYSHMARHDSTAAFERFVFEELAVNGAHDLSGTDPEKLFGMKDNAAMRFFGTNRQAHFTGIMASVPPEKRGAIFAVFDKLSKPLPETKEDAKAFYVMPLVERGVRDSSLVIGRILRHLPEIESLMAKGKLTEANIVKTLCPDMPSSDWTINGLNEFTHNVDDVAKTKMRDLGLDEDKVEDLGQNIRLVMEETCCTVDEAVEAVMTGKRVAPPKYMTNATYDIYKLDGTTKAARAQLDGGGAGDLFRAYDYGAADDPKNAEKFFIKDKDSLAFGFTFPDGTSLKANAGVHKGNIPQILDKLESLAGRVHPRQQTALLFAVSQAGICALKGGLETYGIASSEHAAVDFTLSRNDKTGDITIRYTSPKALPFSFEWTATVSPDGYVSTTPLKFLSEQQLADAHKADVEGLKNAIGGGNSNPVRDEAAEKAAEMIVASAADDRDLMDLLKMDNYQVVKGFARDFRNEVRSPDEIAVRLQRVKENLDELRTAAKGDPRLFQTGLKHLVLFNGGALKSGTITRLCEMAAREDVSGFQGLSESSSPEDIFEAMCKLDRTVNKLCRESQILENFHEGGGDEAAGVNSFIAGLVFARCDDKALAGFKAAMKSDNGQQMYSAMMQLNDGDFPKGYTIAPQTCNVIQHRVARSLGLSFHEDTWTTLHTVLGQPPGYDSTSFSERPVEDASFRKITDIIVKHVEEVYGSELYDAQINP